MSRVLDTYCALVLGAKKIMREERSIIMESVRDDLKDIEEHFQALSAAGAYSEAQLSSVGERIQRLKRIMNA